MIITFILLLALQVPSFCDQWAVQSPDAIDKGALIEGFHCPNPGTSTNQPNQTNGQPCVEWYGTAPDIGACERITSDRPPLNLSFSPSVCKFNLTGTPPDATFGWTAIFYRNNVILLGKIGAPPYTMTLDLLANLNYDFWITWVKSGVSINSVHQVVMCK